MYIRVSSFRPLAHIKFSARSKFVPVVTSLLCFAHSASCLSQVVSPPRVDPLSSTTDLIPSPYSLNLAGPSISINFNGVSAKSALEMLADRAGYDFVYVKSNPLYSSNSSVSSIASQSTESGPLSSSSLLSRGSSTSQSQQQVIDGERLIYVNIKNRDFSSAVNSVLLASGLQATFRDGIIYAGPDIDTKPIGNIVSKTFRLNQVTAKAAGEFLGNLGATVSITTTVTVSVSEGLSSDEQVEGAASSSTSSSTSTPESTIYSSKVGPLVGLFGVTDERLGSISLVGNPRLIDIAESYLLRIDAKQRQVALDIQIIDFDLDNDFVSSNTAFFKGRNTFILSRNGQASILRGDLFPPSDSQFRGEGAAADGDSPYPTSPIRSDPAAPSRRQPGNQFNPDFQANTLYSFIQSSITSGAAKVLARPSIVLMEDNLASGQSSTESSIEGVGEFQGGIGLSARPNEGRIVAGQTVITNWEAAEEGSGCTAEFSTAGISLAAKIDKIDDIGFVTFQLTPQLSAITGQFTNPTCGNALSNVLSQRILETGRVRVKSGDTLLLTGVISEEDFAAVTKWPLIGDIPLIGQFFRSQSRSRKKRELIITATPTILSSDY